MTVLPDEKTVICGMALAISVSLCCVLQSVMKLLQIILPRLWQFKEFIIATKLTHFLTLGKINRSLMKCYRKRLVDSVGSHQVKVNIAYHHIGVAIATINTCGIYDKQNLAYGEAAHLTV